MALGPLLGLSLESGVGRGDELVFARSRIVVVKKDGLEQVKFMGKKKRDGGERGEDTHTGQSAHLSHDDGPHAQKQGPPVHNQNRLALIEALVHKPMVDMPSVGLADAHVRPRAANDGREGVEDGDGRDHQRDDDRGESSETGDGEQRCATKRKAKREGAGITHKDGRRVKVEAQKNQEPSR